MLLKFSEGDFFKHCKCLNIHVCFLNHRQKKIYIPIMWEDEFHLFKEKLWVFLCFLTKTNEKNANRSMISLDVPSHI